MISWLLRLARWLSVTGVLFLLAVFALSPFYIYHQLNTEIPIAELYFEKESPRHYRAFLATGDLCDFKTYLLAGDQWQLDARFLKWKPWVEALGMPSLYQLERFSGRYRSTDEEQLNPKVSHDVARDTYLDWFDESGEEGALISARYGSSVYMELDENKTYRVYKTEDGLLARAIDRTSLRREEGLLLLTVDRSCSVKPGFIERLSILLNYAVVR